MAWKQVALQEGPVQFTHLSVSGSGNISGSLQVGTLSTDGNEGIAIDIAEFTIDSSQYSYSVLWEKTTSNKILNIAVGYHNTIDNVFSSSFVLGDGTYWQARVTVEGGILTVEDPYVPGNFLYTGDRIIITITYMK